MKTLSASLEEDADHVRQVFLADDVAANLRVGRSVELNRPRINEAGRAAQDEPLNDGKGSDGEPTQ